MDKPERLHRPDAPRTEPIRDFMSYMRGAGLGAGVDTPDQPGSVQPGAAKSDLPKSDTAMDQAVAHGVTLGYTVIDDQIRQGEKLAERLRQVAGKPSAMPAQEVGTLIERALNLYKDMGALAIAAVETMVRSPVLQTAVAKALQPASPPATNDHAATPDGTGGRTSFGLELTSGRRTQVKLEIRPGAVTLMPVVHALHAANPDLPPLTGARFRLDPASATPLLQIDVPDGQPAGTYRGVVIDSGTEEPCGTLSVRVLPNPA